MKKEENFYGDSDPWGHSTRLILHMKMYDSWVNGHGSASCCEDWRQEEKGTTEDEMVGWHHQLDGHEFEQALGVGEGQGSLASCCSWGQKDSDTIEQLIWSELRVVTQSCLTLCDPVDCSLPGSSVHWILQARILEWVAISYSRRSSSPRNQTWVSCIAGSFFIIWVTREAYLYIKHIVAP